MQNGLTTASYWGKRQHKTKFPKDREALKDLLDSIESHLIAYKNQQWIELGCSPGHISSLLYRRIPFQPSGVDFSPKAYLYTEIMKQTAGVDATLFQSDIFEFNPDSAYDVVMSFGLVEHFNDPQNILDQHYRLCRKGGLIVISIPHFRKLQWCYHILFNRPDIKRHNLKIMNLETFRQFAKRRNLEVLCLRYVGGMYFWNVDSEGPRLLAMFRKLTSLMIRGVVNRVVSKLLPRNLKIYAPWIVFIARCK